MRSRLFLSVLVGALAVNATDVGLSTATSTSFVASARAQEPAQPTFRTEANYIRVDVYPTANGAPVTDLRKEEFQLADEGAPQSIETFEFVSVTGPPPQDARREPNTVAESRAALENPRARVFVLFLDYYHVDVAGSRNIRETLVGALDRFLGPDDLVAVMTPEMSALDLSFARKTTTIRGMLEKHWTWGERNQLRPEDPQDVQYRSCFPRAPALAEELIERRREKVVLDALQDVVRYLRGAREERKAILTVSAGWRLFQPDEGLLEQKRPPDVRQPVGVDPRTGRLIPGDTTGGSVSVDQRACEGDRLLLARSDNAQQFREIVEEANRANAAFYPLDPRGLAPFDEPIAKPTAGGRLPPMLPPSEDAARLRARADSLRTLAVDTDGLAIVQTNDLERGFRRIVTDLSSYYLLGYYSNRRMDGRFHSIRVRVTRPGVQVRARRGYLAPAPAEMTAAANRAKAAASSPLDPALLEARAVDAALAPLNSLSRERPLQLHAVAGWRPDARGAAWAVGEVSAAPAWKAGADVDVMLARGGETIDTRRVEVAAGSRHFTTMLMPQGGLTAGDYTVSVRARGRGIDPGPVTTSLIVALASAPAATSALMIRRGPTTGSREVPTADVRFRRTDQLRLEVPAASAEPPSARLLDRNGKPMAVPVTAGVRDDPDGSRWHTAHLVLAPLAPGDYVVEMSLTPGGSAPTERKLVAFRIVP